jgi:hypothetical protein
VLGKRNGRRRSSFVPYGWTTADKGRRPLR